MTLTVSRLQEVVTYCPDTGVMRWRVDLPPRGHQGAAVGSPNSTGRLVVWIDGRAYYVHRLAVLYVTGEWPVAEIGHADDDCGNNRWANLVFGRRVRQAVAAPPAASSADHLWDVWKPISRMVEMA